MMTIKFTWTSKNAMFIVLACFDKIHVLFWLTLYLTSQLAVSVACICEGRSESKATSFVARRLSFKGTRIIC